MDCKCLLQAALSLSLLLLLCNCGVSGQFELRRPFHPRLKMTPEELKAARADEKTVDAARTLGESTLRLDKTGSYKEYWIPLPEAPFPKSHNGDTWPYWTGLCGSLRTYLSQLAYAYAVTRDRCFFDACHTAMMSICDWPQWTDPDYDGGKYPCLDTRSLIFGVTEAYDYLYEDLSEADRQTVRAAIVEKGCERVYPYTDQDNCFVADPNIWPNGFVIVNSAMGIGALTVMGEVDGVDEYLSKAIEKMNLFFDEQGGQDGGLLEGFSYGSVVNIFMYLIESADGITGVDLFTHPFLSQVIYFPVYFVLPGGGSVVNFTDAGGPTGCNPTLIDTAQALVKVKQSSLAAWYLVKADKADDRAKALAKQPDDLPLARKFRSIRWAAFRSGWSSDDSLLAFKSGFTKNHNHLDQNHFIFGYGRHWVINDPGYQIYNRPYPPERNMSMELIKHRHDYTYGTYGHNSILVDGRQQLDAEGQLGDLYATPALCYTVGDATACYADRLSKFLRHVISVPGSYYLILDEITARDADRSVEILLHTPTDGEFMVREQPLAEDETTDAAFLTIRRGTAQVALDMLGPQKLAITHNIWPDSVQYGHYITCSTGGKQADFINLMALRAGPGTAQFAPLDGALKRSDDGRLTINVALPDGPDVVGIGPGEHGPLTHDGAVGMIAGSGGTRYALCNGTKLLSDGKALVQADAPVTVGGVLRDRLFRAEVTAEHPVSVTMHVPVHSALVRIAGIEEPIEAAFDEENMTLTLSVQPGRYLIELREL